MQNSGKYDPLNIMITSHLKTFFLLFRWTLLLCYGAVCVNCLAVANAYASEPMLQNWIDQNTGRRVRQITDIPYSTLPYFTVNMFSYDQRWAVFSSPRGLHILNLKDFSSSLLIDGRHRTLWIIGAARKSNRFFYLAKSGANATHATLESIDVDSGAVRTHANLPESYRVESINADDTFAAGVFESEQPSNIAVQYRTKGEALYGRFQEKRTAGLFSVDLKDGTVREIYRSAEWLTHPQFSPSDPKLLMYSVEGPWHLVDRIWLIKIDGSERRLVHRRSIDMEIAGHEFWSADGKRVIYDWQFPKGVNFFLASFDVKSGAKSAASLERDYWSVHFNSTVDPTIFVGDGADIGQVSRSRNSAKIYLYQIAPVPSVLPDKAGWSTGKATVESLVDIGGHDYALEPNARMTPDGKWVLFRSNMFGPPHVFAVEVQKSGPDAEGRRSTYELSSRLLQRYRSLLMLD